MPFHEDEVTTLVLTTDNKYAISASLDKTIKIWDVDQREEIRTLYGHKNSIVDLALTPDGRQVLSASWDKTIKIWNIKTGTDEATLGLHKDIVNCLTITPDGKQVVSISSGPFSGTINVSDLKSGLVKSSFPIDDFMMTAVAITADNQHLVTTSAHSRVLSVRGLNSGKQTCLLFNGTISRKYSLALSPDGCFALSGGDRGDVILWNIEEGRAIFQLEQKTIDTSVPNFWQDPGLMIYDVAFLNNGNRFMSAGGDGTIKIWDTRSGALTSNSCSGVHLTACAISPDGKIVVAGDQSGQIHFLPFAL